MDVSLICGSCINHVKLINQVYPSSPGEEGPKNSNLSQLVFYAETKSHKLKKIGTHLNKRLLIDLRKQRLTYVKVTLEITNQLIIHCNDHINLFAYPALKIVYETINYLGTQNPDMILHATTTFVTFSQYYQHDSLVDPEFTDMYMKTLKAFCQFASYQTSDEAVYHKLHLSGLRAIQAVSSSDSFTTNPLFDQYIPLIIPAVLQNLLPPPTATASEGNLTNSHSQKRDSLPSKRASITDDLITDSELSTISNTCLQELFCRSNASLLKVLLRPVLEFCDGQSVWNDEIFIVYVFKCVTDATATQYRYVVTTSILDRLNEKSNPGNSSEDRPNRRSSLIRVLKYLIESGTGIAGMTVLEILDVLIKLLTTCSNESDPSSVRDCEVIVGTISNLAAHLQYPEQLNDIFAFILNRLRGPSIHNTVSVSVPIPISGIHPIAETSGIKLPEVTLDEPTEEGEESPSSEVTAIDSVAVARLRVWFFKALKGLVHARIRTVTASKHSILHSEPLPITTSLSSSDGNISRRTSEDSKGRHLAINRNTSVKKSLVFRNPINVDIITPMIAYMFDDDVNVRQSVGLFLCALVELDTADNDSPSFSSETHRLRKNIHQVIHTYLSRFQTPYDYSIVLTVLTTAVKRYKFIEIVDTVPLLYSKKLDLQNGFIRLWFKIAGEACSVKGLEWLPTGIWSELADVDSDMTFRKSDADAVEKLERAEVISKLEANHGVQANVPLCAEVLRAEFLEGVEFLEQEGTTQNQDNLTVYGNSAPARMQRRQSASAGSTTSSSNNVQPKKSAVSIRTGGARSFENVSAPTVKFDELKDALLVSSYDVIPPVPPLPTGVVQNKNIPNEVSSLLKSISIQGKKQPSPEPQMYNPTTNTSSPMLPLRSPSPVLSPPTSPPVISSKLPLLAGPQESPSFSSPKYLLREKSRGSIEAKRRSSATDDFNKPPSAMKHSSSMNSLRMNEPVLRDFA